MSLSKLGSRSGNVFGGLNDRRLFFPVFSI